MTCYIYVISVENPKGELSSPSKVGISDNPEKRLKALQTGHFAKLGIACYFAVPEKRIARDLEDAFHKVNSDRRLAGEWFDMPAIEAVSLMCANLRASLESHTGDDESFDDAAQASGLLAVEKMLLRGAVQ
jgi:hypothetical protein